MIGAALSLTGVIFCSSKSAEKRDKANAAYVWIPEITAKVEQDKKKQSEGKQDNQEQKAESNFLGSLADMLDDAEKAIAPSEDIKALHREANQEYRKHLDSSNQYLWLVALSGATLVVSGSTLAQATVRRRDTLNLQPVDTAQTSP